MLELKEPCLSLDSPKRKSAISSVCTEARSPCRHIHISGRLMLDGSSDREYACLLVAGLAGAPSLLPRHRPGERLVAGVTRGEVGPSEVASVSRIVSSFNHVQC